MKRVFINDQGRIVNVTTCEELLTMFGRGGMKRLINMSQPLPAPVAVSNITLDANYGELGSAGSIQLTTLDFQKGTRTDEIINADVYESAKETTLMKTGVFAPELTILCICTLNQMGKQLQSNPFNTGLVYNKTSIRMVQLQSPTPWWQQHPIHFSLNTRNSALHRVSVSQSAHHKLERRSWVPRFNYLSKKSLLCLATLQGTYTTKHESGVYLLNRPPILIPRIS